MSVLTTIELKQLAGRKNGETGGDWSNTLMKPIYIEDGDIVSLDNFNIRKPYLQQVIKYHHDDLDWKETPTIKIHVCNSHQLIIMNK